MKTACRLPLAMFAAVAISLTASAASAATITVNSTADVAADDGVCTLREAITAANTNAASGATVGECAAGSGTDSIQFNIGSGTPTIVMTAALPGILEAVTIDGNTGGATRVELNGNGISGNGLFLDGHGNTIRNLVINRFIGDGIRLNTSNNNTIQGNYIGTSADGTTTAGFGNSIRGILVDASHNNTIGGVVGTTPGGACSGACNVISGNSASGILLSGAASASNANTIQGNFIGTDVTGTLDRGNGGDGISPNHATNTVIGGNAAGRNIISGNGQSGIGFGLGNKSGAVVQGNHIGVDTTRTAVIPNKFGISSFSSQSADLVTIGGVGAGNVIGGNAHAGIKGKFTNSIFEGNYVGTNTSGTVSLTNGVYSGQGAALEGLGGIVLQEGSSANRIGGDAQGAGNVVAFNRGAGVRLGADNFDTAAGTGNIIRGNSIYRNNGLGLSLNTGGGIMVTPLANDAGDGDTGANNRQNYPVLTSLTESGGTVTVQGTLNSTASTEFALDFYTSVEGDGSGYGEGQTYRHTADVTTDANGDASFSVQFQAVGGQPFISATATSSTGNTSEFSNRLSYDNPGNFGFNTGNYAVGEDVATTTITVVRINGAIGSACVNYATSNGTATAGSDYTATAGTLCFDAGELSKTFTVSIMPDATPEADETVTLTLSNPTVGAGLAAQSSATLTIVNEDSFETFVVNNPGDTNDGTCSPVGTGDGCTLREAINAANATPEQDTIAFALTGDNPTITLGSGLPAITARLLINGNTGGATRVEINGGNITAHGLTLTSSAGRSRIYRLVINRFNGSGIQITGSSDHIIQGNFIGTDSTGTLGRGNADGGITLHNSNRNLIGGTVGTSPGGACTGVCNLISGNSDHGIAADPRGGFADGNVIQGNFIGTDITGTQAISNSRGIDFLNKVNYTLIGGASANARNLISGNSNIGVFMSAAHIKGNVVQGNYIGVNTTADAKLGNSVGVVLFFTATENSIIGNVVGGNTLRGIELSTFGDPAQLPPHHNVVQGNFVGTDPSGTRDLGNGRSDFITEAMGGIVLVQGTYNNLIGGPSQGQGNVVAFNYPAGIRLGTGSGSAGGGAGNSILNNSVYSNAGLGISLVTADSPLGNDFGDGDGGANNRQNYPILSTPTSSSGGMVTVTGSLNSVPNTDFTIQFFVSAAADPSGNGEGQTFLASRTVTTNSSGNASIAPFTYRRIVGQTFISATATNKVTGDTSEFSSVVTDPTPPSSAPVVDASDANANLFEPATISATFTDGDGPAPYTATIACGNGTSASNVTVNATSATTGTVSGTCTYWSVASYTARITVFDDYGVSAYDDASVAVNAGPTANGGSLTTDEDTAANGTLSGSDPENSTLMFEIVDAPTKGAISNFDSAAGTFTYTPNANENGDDSFTFRVSDGQAASGPATIFITINPVNDAPTADAGSITTDEDVPVSGNVSGTDVEGAALTYDLASTPGKGVITAFDRTTGAFTYAPNTNENGSDSFTFKVSDGPSDSSAATVSITINAVNDAPTVGDRTEAVDEDGSFPITFAGSDIDGDSLTFSVVAPPSNGTVTGTSPNFTYTPNANFSGLDTFSYKANDGAADSNTATVIFDVAPVNDAPTASAQQVLTDEDTAKLITLSGSDVEGDALTFTVLTQPTNGTLSGTAPNLTYTPDANYNGADSFTFKVNDGQVDSSAATVSITVNAVNDAPVVSAQSVMVDEDSSVAVTLTGSDIDNDALTFSIVTQPANGTLSGSGATRTYTPNADYHGSDSFTFKASDGQADSNTATVAITVSDVAEPTPTPTPSPTASPAPSPSPSPNATPGRAINISTRVQVGTGENAMIGGFIVTGNANKKVIVRGIGPSLTEHSVPGPLADPVLALHGPDGSLIVANDNWKDTQQSAIEQSQVAPTNELEAAIVATLQPGAYTAIVTGRENTTGAALVEVYDLDSPADSGLSNISTRGEVQANDGFMIAGFMLAVDNTGSELVIRALGPSLTQAGITNPLADPTLDLRDANGERLVFNDDWTDDAIDASAITAAGLAPTGATESAIAISLPPGAYTAIVGGAGGTTGVALVEVYVIR